MECRSLVSCHPFRLPCRHDHCYLMSSSWSSVDGHDDYHVGWSGLDAPSPGLFLAKNSCDFTS